MLGLGIVQDRDANDERNEEMLDLQSEETLEKYKRKVLAGFGWFFDVHKIGQSLPGDGEYFKGLNRGK